MDRESYFNDGPRPVDPYGGSPRKEADPSEGIKIRQLLESIRVRIWTVLFVWFLTIFVMVVQVWTQTPLYRSIAVLEIEPRQNLLPFQDLAGRGETANIDTQITLLRSGNVLAKVVEDLALTTHPEFVAPIRRGFFTDLAVGFVDSLKRGFTSRETRGAISPGAALARLQTNLSIGSIKDTNLIRVAYSSPDRELSRTIAEAVADTFIETSLAARYNASLKATDFLQQQLAGLQDEIEQSQDQMLDFARDKNLSLESSESTSGKRLDDLLRMQTEAEAQAANLRAHVDALRSGNSDGLPDSVKPPELRNLESQIARKEQELTGLTARYGPEWPSVRQARTELTELRGELEGTRDRAAQLLLGQYQTARRLADNFASQVRSERRSANVDSEAAVQLEILDRKTQTNKQLYDGILQRLRETDIVSQLQAEGIRVSIPADRPNSQYAPNKTRTTLIAIALGLALGIAAALALEFLDQTVKSSDHITESIGLPVLGTVPAIEADERKWWMPRVSLPGKKRKRTPPKLLSTSKRDRRSNIVRESYRSVRTSLLLASASEPPRTILVTSALPAEGKSTTVANMAISFASNDAKTLVIDLDLRKPALAPLFGVDSEHGMSNFLAGRSEFADLLQPTKHQNLALVSAGQMAPNPTELLGSKRMRWCLGVASEHFDVVLIDTPPSLELSDALIVSPYVDGVVIVARAGQTPREAVRRTSLRFQRAGARILGALINGADLRNPDYGYYYAGYASRAYDYHYAGTSGE